MPQTPILYVFMDKYLDLYSLGISLPHRVGTLFILVQALDIGWSGTPYYIDVQHFDSREEFVSGRTIKHEYVFQGLSICLDGGNALEDLRKRLSETRDLHTRNPYDGIKRKFHCLLDLLEREGVQEVNEIRDMINHLPPRLYYQNEASSAID
ncbi:hypothetical protein EV182_000077 [Spiromyces aspiralis]|uniref:Uncharacterized protein n=1 Tax=Spiromyces aspiralis TaxID=68401 RepID=A0ACC1HJQ5_9FUNG|nr:hypothetical protein EV182_000077 [Spiromyces aspiralis]